MKVYQIFVLFIIFVSFVNFHSLGRFLIDEPLIKGELNEGYFTVRNTHSEKVKDVNVKLYIYDLGLRFNSPEEDISKKDHTLKRMFIPLSNNVKPGVYLAKITVSNDDFKDTQHVYLRIV
ncbi:MAG: hypothetical protein KJ561_08015 [Nanoarchaeota archaeon]|nr:hypothetical protein [Nanoarchaeota archaeon]